MGVRPSQLQKMAWSAEIRVPAQTSISRWNMNVAHVRKSPANQVGALMLKRNVMELRIARTGATRPNGGATYKPARITMTSGVGMVNAST